MKIRNYKILIRKSHRYLGVFIGIQFLLWTISGLYFSWTNITEIRGDHLRQDANAIKPFDEAVSPTAIQNELMSIDPSAKISSFRIVNVLATNYFEAVYNGTGEGNKMVLFDTKNGKPRPSVSQKEAEKIAENALAKWAAVKNTVLLSKENVGLHHEYREKPLPAWAVTFDHPEDLTVYVSADNGQVQSFRTRRWRVFDFLWMLHTMDFIGRDDINNWVLKIYTVLSLLMIVSGFLYFVITARSPWKTSVQKADQNPEK